MKKVTILVILVISSAASICQQTRPSQPVTREDYLIKSKNQKTAAKVLLIGGGVLLATSIIILAPGNISFDKQDAPLALGAIGALAALGSVPLFISSGRNKRRAMNITSYINLEKGSFIQQENIKFARYPSISIRINL